MAKAKVELKRAVSFSVRGLRFRKNEPHVLTDAADIAFFKTCPEFSVTVLKEVVAKKPLSKKPVSEPPPPAGQVLDEGDLAKLTKNTLIQMGMDRFALALDNELKKGDMIAAILDAQSDDDDDDDEDDGDDS